MEDWMQPMLCDRADSDRPYLSEIIWAAEGKLDGWRAIVHKDEHDTVHLYSGRNAADYTGQLPYLEERLLRLLPTDTAIDGELISPAGHSAIGSCMRTNHAHRPSNALPALYLVVFDILRVSGSDVRAFTWEERRGLIEHLPEEPGVLMRSLVLPNMLALEAALDARLEGVVFKRRDSRYQNRRSTDWIKVKPQATADARVVGFKPGEGSFAGMVGAIEFELLENGVRSRCSGFDMRLRSEITLHQQEWLGRIIEIKHHGMLPSGKPRHPQFIRLREDREPVDSVQGRPQTPER